MWIESLLCVHGGNTGGTRDRTTQPLDWKLPNNAEDDLNILRHNHRRTLITHRLIRQRACNVWREYLRCNMSQLMVTSPNSFDNEAKALLKQTDCAWNTVSNDVSDIAWKL